MVLGQAERPHQKYRHLGAGDGLLGAVVSAATARRNAFDDELLDEGGRPVIGRYVTKART